VKTELQDLSDEVYQRTRARLEGLTDEEYLWQPAPGCWTIRPRPDGRWAADWPLPAPEVEPFTTIAWRLWHLIDMYGEDRAHRWLDVPAQGEAVGMDDPQGAPPATASEAITMLERAHDRWDAHLALTTDERLTERIGDVAGPQYADRSRAAFVLHMLDEFIHHGAEVSLLRDLWRWQRPLADDPIVELIMRGDARVVERLGGSATAEQVDLAARYGRWDIVTAMVESGADVRSRGTTLLHRAAGSGEVALVELLLDRGADPAAIDPQFKATPRQWAEFLQRRAVVEVLDRRTRAAE
jgi:hypothetical protein